MIGHVANDRQVDGIQVFGTEKVVLAHGRNLLCVCIQRMYHSSQDTVNTLEEFNYLHSWEGSTCGDCKEQWRNAAILYLMSFRTVPLLSSIVLSLSVCLMTFPPSNGFDHRCTSGAGAGGLS